MLIFVISQSQLTITCIAASILLVTIFVAFSANFSFWLWHRKMMSGLQSSDWLNCFSNQGNSCQWTSDLFESRQKTQRCGQRFIELEPIYLTHSFQWKLELDFEFFSVFQLHQIWFTTIELEWRQKSKQHISNPFVFSAPVANWSVTITCRLFVTG